MDKKYSERLSEDLLNLILQSDLESEFESSILQILNMLKYTGDLLKIDPNYIISNEEWRGCGMSLTRYEKRISILSAAERSNMSKVARILMDLGATVRLWEIPTKI